VLAATPTAGDHGVIVFDVFGYVARSPTHLPLSLPGPSSQRYLSLPTFPTGRYLVHPSRYDKVAGAPPGTLSLRSGFVLKRALRHKIAAQFGVDSQDLFLLDTGGPCGILLGLGCVRRCLLKRHARQEVGHGRQSVGQRFHRRCGIRQRLAQARWDGCRRGHLAAQRVDQRAARQLCPVVPCVSRPDQDNRQDRRAKPRRRHRTTEV
jgi:hypothetical protein